MLCTNLDQLRRARREGYAVPAINTQGGNYDIIMAICKAAEELKSPVILAHYVSTGAYSGHDWFYQVAKWCAQKVSVPVSIHLDHGSDFEICMEALRLGFTSLMIDGSTLPVRENAKLTESVVKVARCFRVPVEAEIGELQRLDSGGSALENKNLADPEQVKEFLSLCHPDTLAVGIGNAHGFYKGTPDIHLDILEKVRSFCDLPLVLHGCTGMDENIIRKAVRELGIAKINFGTEIRWKYIEHLREGLNTDHQGHSWKVSQFACNALTEDVKRIIALSGSEGKAE
ncbi:MAG: class II fructose-bisphosphate aldolase [Clostridia bacterium]|nr:class II fructose-bisphosphate aldolase [Clostridia bacterium]